MAPMQWARVATGRAPPRRPNRLRWCSGLGYARNFRRDLSCGTAARPVGHTGSAPRKMDLPGPRPGVWKSGSRRIRRAPMALIEPRLPGRCRRVRPRHWCPPERPAWRRSPPWLVRMRTPARVVKSGKPAAWGLWLEPARATRSRQSGEQSSLPRGNIRQNARGGPPRPTGRLKPRTQFASMRTPCAATRFFAPPPGPSRHHVTPGLPDLPEDVPAAGAYIPRNLRLKGKTMRH